PRSPSAVVLVALFVGRFGDLYVLLNRYVLDTDTRGCPTDQMLGGHQLCDHTQGTLHCREERSSLTIRRSKIHQEKPPLPFVTNFIQMLKDLDICEQLSKIGKLCNCLGP
ncbi:hypothetical protein B0H17DRAFT_953447, partial [Mycena rosella]